MAPALQAVFQARLDAGLEHRERLDLAVPDVPVIGRIQMDGDALQDVSAPQRGEKIVFGLGHLARIWSSFMAV
jgi:hypothetical protein